MRSTFLNSDEYTTNTNSNNNNNSGNNNSIKEEVQNEMKRVFGNLYTLPDTSKSSDIYPFKPIMDIIETKDDVLLQVELPGVRSKDINVEVEDNILFISGSKYHNMKNRSEADHLRRSERNYGKFSRQVRFSEDLNPDVISASYSRGVLEVTLPKPLKERKKILIKVKALEEEERARRIAERSSDKENTLIEKGARLASSVASHVVEEEERKRRMSEELGESKEVKEEEMRQRQAAHIGAVIDEEEERKRRVKDEAIIEDRKKHVKITSDD